MIGLYESDDYPALVWNGSRGWGKQGSVGLPCEF
jgi:hypothetical protein